MRDVFYFDPTDFFPDTHHHRNIHIDADTRRAFEQQNRATAISLVAAKFSASGWRTDSVVILIYCILYFLPPGNYIKP
jgi:hypothetical protein